jgi:hypothetical protein
MCTATRPGWCPLLAAAALAAGGCGSGDRVTVKGTVTLDGAPLEGANVSFMPEDDKGLPANGVTDAEGRFSLGTLKAEDGARPGSYKVTVTKVELNPATLETFDSRDPAQVRAMREKASKKYKPPPSPVPAKYSDPGKTPLRWKVPDDGDKTLDLKTNG